MSSQVRQPCQALELPPKSWPQIPWRADQRSASFQKLPLGSGMAAGFWVWILWGFLGKCTVLRFGAFCKKSAKNPHPKSAHPVEKSAPKSAPKIRTQNPHQNPHQNPPQNPTQNPRPNFQPIPTETHNRKCTRGVPLATRCCYSRRSPKIKKNRTKNPLRDSGGNLVATKAVKKCQKYFPALFDIFRSGQKLKGR